MRFSGHRFVKEKFFSISSVCAVAIATVYTWRYGSALGSLCLSMCFHGKPRQGERTSLPCHALRLKGRESSSSGGGGKTPSHLSLP